MDLNTLHVELGMLPEFAAELEPLLEKRRRTMGRDLMDASVARVEIMWQVSERTESSHAVLPPFVLLFSVSDRSTVVVL